MDSDDIFEYAISYPYINHPLYAVKADLKLKYVGLLEYYARQYYDNNPIINARISRFKQDFLKGISDSISDKFDIKTSAADVMKTRFTPFRFFSFRYIFFLIAYCYWRLMTV